MKQHSKTVSELGKTAMIAIIAMFIAGMANAQVKTNSQKANQRSTKTSTQVRASKRKATPKSIKTVYPTKDWVISDFVVTDKKFGAKAKKGFDNRAAFQAAIDSAYKNGGGVVYVPAGHYEFRSTQTASQSVRVRQGSAPQVTKSYDYQYVLNIPTSVQLRGDWADPELHNGKVLGTILEVRVGKNSPNYNGTVASWFTDSQANNAQFTTYTSIADRFIDMKPGTGVTNLSIWYPEQDINDVKPYPWTLFQPSGDCATIEHVTLVNAYNGFYSAPSELHYVLNSYITALSTGLEVHVCTDIGRIENVKIDPKYWANSGLPGSPSLAKVTAYTKANATGFNMHRSDWEYVSNFYVSGYKTGMWVGREPGSPQTPNAQFYEMHIKNCDTGIYVQAVNPYGLLFSNSTFGAEKGGTAVYFYKDFKTSTQFNGVDFTGPIVSDGSDGVISFEGCTFGNYSDYALKVNSGNVLLTQCDFKKPGGHVFLGTSVNTLQSINSGYKNKPVSPAYTSKLEIKNDSKSAKVEINNNKDYLFAPIPKNIVTNIKVYPKPLSNNLLKVDLPRATGYNNDRPTEDVSAKLQMALNKLKAAGGGTLYLPAGRYLVDNPVKVPSGVELRGTWDVQHYTQGGTTIFTNYSGGDAGEKGPSLIQLGAGAGLRGVVIAQLNLATDGFTSRNPRSTPFLVQGQGPKVYIINLTIGGGDKGIDLASYNTSGHYVDYLGGVLARAGIWVGGGATGGFIRNMQLNPGYGTRMRSQGYPTVSLTGFVQSNCSALKFADVKNETIFNNFVYGSFYGIHFLKDAITGKDPGKMTVIGHGSDGCSYSFFVEDADKNTKITAINSELVCTKTAEPVRAYVLMGNEVKTNKVDPDAQITLYNTAFWGTPTIAAIINSGTVRFQQGNFQSSGAPAIDNRGGKVHIYSSYFSHKMPGEATGDNVYAKLQATGVSIELTNNYYISGYRENNVQPGKIYGSDIVSDKK